MPRVIFYILLLLVALSLVPMGVVYKSRHTAKHQTRIQVVYDMDSQFSYKPQSQNGFFADGRAGRSQPVGTVARGQLREDDVFQTGSANGDTVLRRRDFPLPVTPARDGPGPRAVRHLSAPPATVPSGNGGGPVHAARRWPLAEGTWTPADRPGGRATVDRSGRLGHIYNTIRNGDPQHAGLRAADSIPADRWAIVAYVTGAAAGAQRHHGRRFGGRAGGPGGPAAAGAGRAGAGRSRRKRTDQAPVRRPAQHGEYGFGSSRVYPASKTPGPPSKVSVPRVFAVSALVGVVGLAATLGLGLSRGPRPASHFGHSAT